MSSTSPSAAPGSRRWLALGLIAAAQFMVIMDTSTIGVALPEIQQDLGFTSQGLSWVFNAYVVAFGGLLLLGGRLGPARSRRVFSAGWVVLAVGSLVAGAAGSPAVELVGRAVQGAVGAHRARCSDPAVHCPRFDAEGVDEGAGGRRCCGPAGGTAGVFLGGVLTQFASWPWVFFINVPLAAAVDGVTPTVMPAGTARRGSVDDGEAITVTLGLGSIVFAVVRAPQAGWTSASTLVAGLVGSFWSECSSPSRPSPTRRWCGRHLQGAEPGGRQRRSVLLGAAWNPMFFFVNLYLRTVSARGLSPAVRPCSR